MGEYFTEQRCVTKKYGPAVTHEITEVSTYRWKSDYKWNT